MAGTPSRIFPLLVLSSLIVFFSTPVNAKPFPLSVRVQWSSSYDDNILKYSSRDIGRFENRTEVAPSEVTTLDDWVNTFGVRLYRDLSLSRSIKFRPYYSGKISLYSVNQLKNYQSHYFLGRFSYRYRAYLYLQYFYMPGYYLRVYYDRDVGEYRGCEFNLYQPAIRLRWRFPPYEVEGDLGREFIYYDGSFTEYDSEAIYWGLSGSYDGIEDLNVTLGYAFKVSDNVGFNQSSLVSPVDPSVDTEYGDSSYEEDQYSLRLSYHIPFESNWDWEVSLAVQRRLRYYQSDLSTLQDPFHIGRKDRRDIIEPAVSFSPSSQVQIELRFSYDLRRTDSPDPVVSSIKNYDDHSFEFSVDYRIF